MKQCFVSSKKPFSSTKDFDRHLYYVRRLIDKKIREKFELSQEEYYVPSFSCRTIVYKGMLLGEQFKKFYIDMQDADIESAIAIFHMRYSTNTFPSWNLAQPFRYLGHNGEINTLKGNKNWMLTRQSKMESPYWKENIQNIFPIVLETQSDSASFDSVLELLAMSDRSLTQSIMMMIPEAWSKNYKMNADLKAFYEYNATIMEPWDGPAAIVFSDGRYIGSTLDRNGLRPARYIITKDDFIIMASEIGSIDIKPDQIAKSGRIEPGSILLVDTKEKRIISNDELKQKISSQKPYKKWIQENLLKLSDISKKNNIPITEEQYNNTNIRSLQKYFGYTREKIVHVLKNMVNDAKEPIGSMGADVSLAIFSERQPTLFKYFKQQFAQVTNPAIDAIREELVMDLSSYIGPEKNLLEETPLHAHRLKLSHPILKQNEILTLQNSSLSRFNTTIISLLFSPDKKGNMEKRLQKVFKEAENAIQNLNTHLLILSDKGVSKDFAAIPSLLAVSGLHHHLIRLGLRTKVGIIIETAEASEVFEFALLCGYGANAIYPYLAFETIAELFDTKFLEINSFQKAQEQYLHAIKKGLFKIFSKMGISTLQSYCGAQIFESIGLSKEITKKYFPGTISQIDGIGINAIERETVERHQKAEFEKKNEDLYLESGGFLHYRTNSENHLWTPETIAKLQQSTSKNDVNTYKEYSNIVNHQKGRRITLRSLLEITQKNKSVPIEEVEPALEIVKRFSTGAMSYGSISWEAHTNLAIAMNRLKAKSNTGEGGEDPIRFQTLKNGDTMRSSIKQIASGRFGVTANYLLNADELQIKIAQGAKPGEGGQLPGIKVDEIIAKVRHSTPGVTLISPPPHHDIYSIEDLKQLIFDLKNSNPKARISVKLVSELGVGTIAAGVVKAHADHIVIAGHDGGTGASPISSIHHAGTPWELGLSETHQTLVLNGLRDRVYLATDGQIRTGKDVVVAGLLGADEFGFSTSALVTQGCILMRKCHLNTCPVGIATQDKELRKKFTGKPEHLVNYILFVVQEVREIMAQLGYRNFNELIGQTQNLHFLKNIETKDNWKASSLDYSKILEKPDSIYKTNLYRSTNQKHQIEKQKDNEFIKLAQPAILHKKPITIQAKVYNTDRTLGTLLSYKVTEKHGEKGLPQKTICLNLEGMAGQSLGAFINKGIFINLRGMANDYVAKGLSGGIIIIQPGKNSTLIAEENVIVGNVCLYGATSGEFYANGTSGERFAIRNSGAKAILEGMGDHGCEYMTGGFVVVIGKIGRNFAAGMSGGIAVIFNPNNTAQKQINTEMVKLYSLEETEYVLQTKKMIQKHLEYTNSNRAKYILQNWKNLIKQFILVMPKEYEMALEKIKAKKLKEEKIIQYG